MICGEKKCNYKNKLSYRNVKTQETIPFKEDYVKLLRSDFLFILVLIWVQIFGNIVTNSTYIFLIFYALLSSERAIKALTMGVILCFLNPGLFSGSEYSYFLRWVLLFSAACSVYLSQIALSWAVPKYLFYLFIFSVASTIFSLLNSYTIFVSLAKIIVFFIGFSTVLLGFKQTTNSSWRSWYFTFFSAVLISSIPLLCVPEGYVRNLKGFQGILNHPQAYGVYMVVPTIWLTGIWLVNKKVSSIMKIIILGGWITIFATRSRAAILAAVLGILFTAVIAFFRRPSWNNNLLMIIRKPVFIAMIFLVIIVTMFPGNIVKETIGNFIYKNLGSIYENIYKSRGFLIERSWKNFKEHPLIGIGFGVASDKEKFIVKESKNINIPLEAPTEKGFLPTALLEEVGIIGTFLFLIFFIELAKPIIKYGDLPSAWLFWTAFFVSFGEMVFFSPGGLGMHIWLCFGLAINYTLKIKKSIDL